VRVGDAGQGLGRDVGVDLGGARTVVTEQGLDVAQVVAVFEQVGGEAVAQGVDGGGLVDFGALGGRSPSEAHAASIRDKLSATFPLPKGKLPLTEGRVHFMRRVSDAHTISVLNLTWSVPDMEPDQGVWAMLEFRVRGATLSIYDQAPDAHPRRCLVEYPFELKEPVYPLREEFRAAPPSSLWKELFATAILSVARARVALSTML
jgi:hypothetical protein